MSTPVPDGTAVAVPTPDDMRALGERVGRVSVAGDLLVLAGPLGAGKTVFAQGVAAGLGVTSPVTSPTFVIARVHRDGRIPFVHVDAYRLGGSAEVDDLDLDADLDEAVTVVEWGAGLVEHLSDRRLLVTIDRDDADDLRRVTLNGAAPRWSPQLLSALATAARG